MPVHDQFKFRRLDNIGAADASEDGQFLSTCFVDTGDLDALRDCSDPKRLVLGRTGAGKTALLLTLGEKEDRVIRIPPESLALSYISNSTILTYLSQLGVKLDIFYRLLWRHVFTVELIKANFNITSEEKKNRFFEFFLGKFRDNQDRQVLEYLENWGSSFWQDTDYRIKELTKKLESDLKASMKGAAGDFSLEAGAGRNISEEVKADVINRAQTVVNKVQVKELGKIIDTLGKVLDDPQKRFYIVIDRLDENWIDDRLRYQLIRALIETIRDFRTVNQAKIIAAIRFDLLDRVFRLTRDSGFQEEKYESLYLEVNWSKEKLVEVLDNRIACLVQKRYTKQIVGHTDILPRQIEKQSPVDFILERTMMRPRDVILFINRCISIASERSNFTVDIVKQAEGDYSRFRLRALADEWHADYPNLMWFTSLLKNRASTFRLSDLDVNECGDFCIETVLQSFEESDNLTAAALQTVDCLISPQDFMLLWAEVLYRTGLIGLKLESHEPVSWSINGRRSISQNEISLQAQVHVHPFAWRTLGIKNRK